MTVADYRNLRADQKNNVIVASEMASWSTAGSGRAASTRKLGVARMASGPNANKRRTLNANGRRMIFSAQIAGTLTPSKQARTGQVIVGAMTTHNFSSKRSGTMHHGTMHQLVYCATDLWCNAPTGMVHCASDSEGSFRGMALRCMRDGMVTEAGEGWEAAEVSEQAMQEVGGMGCGGWKS